MEEKVTEKRTRPMPYWKWRAISNANPQQALQGRMGARSVSWRLRAVERAKLACDNPTR